MNFAEYLRNLSLDSPCLLKTLSSFVTTIATMHKPAPHTGERQNEKGATHFLKTPKQLKQEESCFASFYGRVHSSKDNSPNATA